MVKSEPLTSLLGDYACHSDSCIGRHLLRPQPPAGIAFLSQFRCTIYGSLSVLVISQGESRMPMENCTSWRIITCNPQAKFLSG